MPKPDLDAAYALASPEDARRLYADWAETYDESFAGGMDFALPGAVADAFVAGGGREPVLDFGCGTGLVGERLARAGTRDVDGVDVSPEMLAVAARKGVYRDLAAGDVLDGFRMAGAPYGGVVSSGTFTTGHVGPEALPALLDMAAHGAGFALSINRAHFEAAGFAAAFDALADRIEAPEMREVAIYGPDASGPHAKDTAVVALFRSR